MSDMRERLTALLTDLDVYNCEECRNCGSYRYDVECDEKCFCGKVAEYLLSHNVAPVVRCKDCKHRDPENSHCDHATGTAIYFPRKPDDFCSYGERKAGDGNG